MARKRDLSFTLGNLILIVIAFILGGAGLSILYNSSGDVASVIGGFALVGMAVGLIYYMLQNG
jgi:uncharacterized Tic20 family protein